MSRHMTLTPLILPLCWAGPFALHHGSQPARPRPSSYFIIYLLRSLMNTSGWLAPSHPLPAIWVRTSLTEKCFFLEGIVLLPHLTPAHYSFPVCLLPGPGKKQSDYGQGRKSVSEMRCPQAWRLMTATLEMKGVPLSQRELLSVRAAPRVSAQLPSPALLDPPPRSPSAFSTPAQPCLPQQARQHPSCRFPALSRAGSLIALLGRASLLFPTPTKDPSGRISALVVSSDLERSKGLFHFFIGEGKCSATLSALPFSQGHDSETDGGDTSMMAGSNVGENILCGSHAVWALQAQAPGLGSLATFLHTVGTQPPHSHQQRGPSRLRETTGATSSPEA